MNYGVSCIFWCFKSIYIVYTSPMFTSDGPSFLFFVTVTYSLEWCFWVQMHVGHENWTFLLKFTENHQNWTHASISRIFLWYLACQLYCIRSLGDMNVFNGTEQLKKCCYNGGLVTNWIYGLLGKYMWSNNMYFVDTMMLFLNIFSTGAILPNFCKTN